eukprot:Transcript_21762.p2 GENE.Transcript_21762~~Transcript_21762.p2  ORF type:complete len:565 (+),score=101.85 Transcript_21762:2110-3804(+)
MPKCVSDWLGRCIPGPGPSADTVDETVYAQVAAAVAASLAAAGAGAEQAREGLPKLSVPRDINDLTPEWLTVAMRLKGHLEPDGEVRAVNWSPIGQGKGMMSPLALVKLELRGARPEAPRCFVAKFAPEADMMDPLQLVHALRNEFHFYHDFTVQSGGLPRPECYLALVDVGLMNMLDSRPGFFLMIEYLGDAVSFTRVGACPEMYRVRQVLSTLAAFHARWWDQPALGWTVHPETGLGSVMFRSHYYYQILKKAIPALEAWEGDPYRPVLAWCPMLLKRMRTIVAKLRLGPFTLLHNDVHLDNIFFSEQTPGGCAFIDYGNMIFGKALMDVAFFLSTNFHPDFRRAHEHELLSFYHRCLVAGGIEEASFSFEQCWLDYRWQTLHIFLTFALFTSRTFEKQRRAGTGPYAPPTRRTVGHAAQLRIFRGDGAGPGWNGRLVAALVDLKCNELVEDAHAYESLRVYQEEQQSFLNAAWRRGFLSAAWRLLLGGSGGCGSSRSSPPSSRASSPPPKRLAAEDRAVIDRIDQMLAAWKFEEAKERARSPSTKSLTTERQNGRSDDAQR